MTIVEFLEWCKTAGYFLTPPLALALIWMNNERKAAIEETNATRSRLEAKIDAKDAKLEHMSERMLVFMAELKERAFIGRNAA